MPILLKSLGGQAVLGAGVKKWLFAVLVSVPLQASAQPAPDAEAELVAAIDLLKAHHMNAKGANWEELESKSRSLIDPRKPAATSYPAIRFLIDRLGEKHTFLYEAKARKLVSSAPASSDPLSGRAMPVIAELPGKLAKVEVYGVSGSNEISDAYERTLRAGLERLRAAGVCRFIVDLRENGGGNMWAMLNGLVSLLGRPPFGSFRFVDGRSSEWGMKNGRVDLLDQQTGSQEGNAAAMNNSKVAVLLGSETTSSGEQTGIALKGLASVRFFGQPTAGYVTINMGYELPDGSSLVISEGYSLDRKGREYRERVDPDVRTEGAATLSAAIDWLQGETCSLD
jgi:hypothetical protein